MAVIFIIPDLLKRDHIKMAPELGLTLADIDTLHEDLIKVCNKPHQREKVEGLYGCVIPSDLPVMVMSLCDSLGLQKKFNLPPSIDVASLTPGVDTKHSLVLFLIEEFLDNESVVAHELVHYDQIKSGRLVYHQNGVLEWTVPGEEMCVNMLDDYVEKQKSNYSINDLLYHEVQKPWELEAYALTTSASEKASFDEKTQKIIESFLSKHKKVGQATIGL